MCTKSRECRLRTEKAKTLMEFRKKEIPAKASKATIKQILTFTDEDIQQIPPDRPCMRGEQCLQQTGGVHSQVCRTQMAEIESLIGQMPNPARPGREEIEEQERYNLDPMNIFVHEHSPRHSYDYEYGQEQEEQRYDQDQEEQRRSNDTNN